MRIGLFFGSFNPLHTGHLIIANHILNFTSLDKICFVVSPQSPLKDHNDLLNAQERFNLVEMAIKTDERFEASNVEFHLPSPSFTITTLEFLKDKYPENDYYLIVGSDNFLHFSAWKSHQTILKDWKIIVYIRPGFPVNNEANSLNINVLSPALIDISSTKIRELIKEGKSIRYLVPESVFAEIADKKFYR